MIPGRTPSRQSRGDVGAWERDRAAFVELAQLKERVYAVNTDAEATVIVERIHALERTLRLGKSKLSGRVEVDDRPDPCPVAVADRLKHELCVRCGREPLVTRTLGARCKAKLAWQDRERRTRRA